MSFIERLQDDKPALGSRWVAPTTVNGVLEVLLPGTSDATKRLRTELEALARDPLARGALILGPAGCGKSTIARNIALLRHLAVLSADRFKALLATMRADGPFRLDVRALDWYVEFSLPGLASSVAVGQLFGYTPDFAVGSQKGSNGRPSIFESAGVGRSGDRLKPTAGAKATNGVVFLDEIGDLDEELQPKLLSVLTGVPTYRVGGEGRDEYSFTYLGLTIAATWRPLDRIRPDLRARLSDHVIVVPSLSERRDEIDAIVDGLLAETKGAHKRWLAGLIGDEETSAEPPITPPPGVDVHGLKAQGEKVKKFAFDAQGRTKLREADWQNLGELRGLAQVIKRAVRGVPIDMAIEQAREWGTAERAGLGETIYAALMSYEPEKPVKGLRSLLGEIEDDARNQLVGVLSDPEKRKRLAEHLGMSSSDFGAALSELKRGRR